MNAARVFKRIAVKAKETGAGSCSLRQPQSQSAAMSVAARQNLPAVERQAHAAAVSAAVPATEVPVHPMGTGSHFVSVWPLSRTQAYGPLLFGGSGPKAHTHTMRGSKGPGARSTH